ncbi:hypothetical protein GCM10009676_31780 [Prauserella halophila]|uniref:Uncharacterized protein n=1 Tax=Prauserella halophila TaxID=185641 RepID=A0ABN1WBY8_9PSEU|nr:hypothetical protein [Prauserella halophila]
MIVVDSAAVADALAAVTGTDKLRAHLRDEELHARLRQPGSGTPAQRQGVRTVQGTAAAPYRAPPRRSATKLRQAFRHGVGPSRHVTFVCWVA